MDGYDGELWTLVYADISQPLHPEQRSNIHYSPQLQFAQSRFI